MTLADDASLNFDDLSDGDDDPDFPLLREFLDRWEGAESPGERDAVFRAFCDEHPALEERVRGLVEATSLVRDATAHDPTRLGPYRIIRVLAVGGMGKVYEAHDDELERTVAVKTIRIGRAADKKLLEQFEDERTALALLHHTHIVPIFGAGEDDGLLYFAMPLIRGLSLADLVATMSRWPSSSDGAAAAPTSWEGILGKATTDATWRRSLRRMSTHHAGAPSNTSASGPGRRPSAPAKAAPPLSEDYFRHVAEVVAVAAEALHSAHETGVLHFDVKPSNILIERTPGKGDASVHPWVIDFGLADTRGSVPDGVAAEGPGRGQRTRGFGTEGFMAPEMLTCRAEAIGIPTRPGDHRPSLGRHTDVWSLGVTLYQLLTLHMPFATDADVLAKDARPKSPREHVPHLPRELEAVVLKALRKPIEEGGRYPTAAAFAEDLRRWLGGFPTVAGEAGFLARSEMWARRKPAAAFAAGMTVAFVILASLGAAHVIQSQRDEVQRKQRELDLLALPRLRAPVRVAGWFDMAWTKVRELVASGGPDTDRKLEGQAAASLEGLDVHLVKPFKKGAHMLAFDPTGKRLLMGLNQQDQGRSVTDLTIAPIAGQDAPTTRRFASFGVVGFRNGDPLFLEQDSADPSVLRLRDAITGEAKLEPLKSPLKGPSTIIAHTISQDGTRAAGVVWPVDGMTTLEPKGDTATLVVWDVATGRIVRALEEKQPPSHDVVLSPDGSLLATWDASGGQHEVAVWSVDDGQSIGRFRSTRNGITSVAFGRDPVWHEAAGPSWRLAVGEHGGIITVWDLHARAVKSIARGTFYDVKTLDFSPDGSLLASAGRGLLMIWDPATGECLLKVPAGSFNFSVAFSPDGRHLAVAKLAGFGWPDGVEVFELENGRGLRTLRGLQQRIEKLAVSGDGRRVAALSNDWEVGVFDTSTGALLGIAESPIGFFTDNAIHALNSDGSRLICSAGSEARLYDVERKRVVRSWKLPPALTEAVAFRPDGRIFLVRQETKGGKLPPVSQADPRIHPRVCRAYELPEQGEPKPIAEITDFDWYVEHIAAAPDGSHFAVQGLSTATGKAARIIHVYDGLTGKKVGPITTTFPPNDAGTGMRFDPKGTRFYVRRDVRDGGRCDIFEVPSLKEAGMATEVNAVNVGVTRWVSIRPPTSDSPGLLLLREQGRDSPLLSIVRDILVDGVEGVKFSPNGNQVLWGNRDGTVTVCDLNEVAKRLSDVGFGW